MKIPVNLRDNKYNLLKIYNDVETNTLPGIVISAKPDDAESKLFVTISGDALSSEPTVVLAQPDYTAPIPMASTGGIFIRAKECTITPRALWK